MMGSVKHERLCHGALAQGGTNDPEHVSACSAKLTGAAEPLLRHAARAGAVAPGMTVADLVTGIALATEHHRAPPPRRTDCST